ncbi:helix-turn-helix transcriptional regulator [Aquipseudomonas ullengensis]|uniref:Helix-turn-helix transcriptional regulator n=1 Tax=Aquipseudomonas ullengensis TaxID=2759166 RepID=A0A7W4LMC1_9GAMM|nr:helix-turn-helix transcriptional regulator [Pseudomonas ullengensis]MBB2495778.1 helix-turn-helix transcriptional regulator [Pseudomonas ullengensis]
MSVQVIMREGQAEYAVLPWAEYQALLQAAGRAPATLAVAPAAANTATATAPSLSELSALREARGMAQADLARAVGISPHYLNMIESGEREPDAAIRRSLAFTLGIDGWEQDS